LTNIVKNSTNSGGESAGHGGAKDLAGPVASSNTGDKLDGGGAIGRLEEHVDRKSYERGFTGWRKLVGAGFEFFGVVLVCVLVGMWLDDKFKLGGMGALGGIVIGVVGGTYLQIRTLLQNGKK